MALVIKNPPANEGDLRDAGSIPGLGRSPGGWHGNLLQYYCLENSMDREAPQSTVHRVPESRTGLNTVSEVACQSEKGTGFGFKVKVAQSRPTLCDPLGYTVHGILQARILEWVAFPFSKGSSQPRDRTQVSRIAGGLFTSWATWEALSFKSWPWNSLSYRTLGNPSILVQSTSLQLECLSLPNPIKLLIGSKLGNWAFTLWQRI